MSYTSIHPVLLHQLSFGCWPQSCTWLLDTGVVNPSSGLQDSKNTMQFHVINNFEEVEIFHSELETVKKNKNIFIYLG